jgi:hypothetical protein
MDSNLTVEQFINHCFQERTACLKRRLEVHHVYWQRFYHSECIWDGRRSVVEKSEAEKIMSISPSSIGFDAVTSGITLGSTVYRSCYHVKPSGGSWLIQEVDMECSHCHGKDLTLKCSECGGTGWLTWKERSRRMRSKPEQPAARTKNSTIEEKPDSRLHRDPPIEHFMADLVRERTAAWNKEFEIHAEYVKRFFSEECDWTRWVPSFQKSEAERILNIDLIDTGARVITNGLGDFRLRYQLRPAGQSWLIREVDTECPICHTQGISTDCFWCSGTIWGRRKGTRS